jgi:polyisoprenoid-binding protein YceI
VLVYRGGALARFGHNHVMVAPVHGQIREGVTAAASGFHLEIEAQAMQVDPPAARAEEGEAFSSEVSSENRDGTRANMLGPRLLDADQYPKILIDSAALTGPRWNPDVEANVTLRGATATVAFPAAVVEHDDTLTIVARLSLRVSDFGIEPFTALGGALQVQDRLDVRIRLVAQREAAP